MTVENVSPRTAALRRIGQSHRARVEVDQNGRPIGLPVIYTYDESGKIVSADKAGDAE